MESGVCEEQLNQVETLLQTVSNSNTSTCAAVMPRWYCRGQQRATFIKEIDTYL